MRSYVAVAGSAPFAGTAWFRPVADVAIATDALSQSLPVSAFPDASTTGPAAAGFTNLTTYTGPTTITTNNTVIQGKLLPDGLVIQANNVKVQGCDVGNFILIKSGFGNTFIWDNLIHSPSQASPVDQLVWCQSEVGLDLRRNNLYWCSSDVIKLGQGPYKLYDNYVHDNTPAIAGVHADMVETFSGQCSGLEIVHNTILYPNSADNTTTCIMLGPGGTDWYENVLVDNNLIGGTNYIMYPPGRGSSSGTPATLCRVTNNHITTAYFPTGGASGVSYHSPSVIMDWTTGGNVWSGNVWHDGPKVGQTITPAD